MDWIPPVFKTDQKLMCKESYRITAEWCSKEDHLQRGMLHCKRGNTTVPKRKFRMHTENHLSCCNEAYNWILCKIVVCWSIQLNTVHNCRLWFNLHMRKFNRYVRVQSDDETEQIKRTLSQTYRSSNFFPVISLQLWHCMYTIQLS